SSLETIDSANEPVPSFTIDNADIAIGAITSLQIDNPGSGYVNGTISATGGTGSGFTGTFTVNSSGAIVSWSITSHGDYSSNPTIVIDGPQSTGSNGALSVVTRATVIDVNITNVGSVIVPVNEVWVFLDGENARNLATLSPIADSDYIYPGDTVGVVWRGLGNTVFETAALSCNGFNTARTLE
ncbi:MAG: hypothetical protein ACPGK2_02440, partial [Candidatus Poseidoniaceae archaeon]